MTKEKGLATQEICLEVMEIIDLFLNNEFSKAEKLVEGREVCICHLSCIFPLLNTCPLYRKSPILPCLWEPFGELRA